MLPGFIFLSVALLASALIGHAGALAVRYLAQRGVMLDRPGRHRSHATPIPRGGGIGIAFALLIVGLAPLLATRSDNGWHVYAMFFAAALVAVAGVGWLDDRRDLAMWPRLLVHLCAGVLMAIAWWGTGAPMQPLVLAYAGASVIAVVASINLHNFFDGGNGLLGMQALFVASCLAALAWRVGHFPLAVQAIALAGGVTGFLPHNVPSARVFLGDSGSGVIGLAVAAIGLLALRDDVVSLPVLIILLSGLVIDTGLTLLHRIALGRRFWTRHREHLYQWLIRSGWTHARVTLVWTAWNLLVALPMGLLALRMPEHAWMCAAIVYASGMSIWSITRHRLLARGQVRARSQARREVVA